jgi:hypothetical protein
MLSHVRTLRIAVAALAAVAALGCTSPFSPDRPDVEISLQTAQELRSAPLTMRVALDRTWFQLTGDPASGEARAQVRAPRAGTLSVQIVLLDVDGDTVATAALQQDFKKGYTNFIDAWVATKPPLNVCSTPALRIQTKLGAADTVYVEYGGMPKDAIC